MTDTRVFGLTGGIASGKTTVARRFEQLGIPVVYADQLAREAVAPGTDGLYAIVEAFGPDVLLDGKKLDRKALAAKTFGDPAAVKRLNSIVHPRVGALAIAAFHRLSAEGHPLVCYEVPLLVENNLTEMFRPVVVVAAPEALQVSRAVLRDNLTEAEARARIQAQLPLEKKVAVADFVIENTGDEAALVSRTDEVAAAVRSWKK